MSPIPVSSLQTLSWKTRRKSMALETPEKDLPGVENAKITWGKRKKWYQTGRIYSDSCHYWKCHNGCDNQAHKILEKPKNHPEPLRKGISTSGYERAPWVQCRAHIHRIHSHPPDNTSPVDTMTSRSPARQKTNWLCQKNWWGWRPMCRIWSINQFCLTFKGFFPLPWKP